LLRNLHSSKRFSIKRVVDRSTERQDFVRSNYPGLDVSGNVDDIFSDKDIDAVVISTPVATHFELAKRSLEFGKHVLVEKPMSTNTSEVRKIGKLSRERGLVAMVGHTFLFNEAVRYVGQMIRNGEIGEIHYIYCQRLNLGRIRKDVDALWNLAPHDVSIIQYWLGDPEPLKVRRFGMDYVQKGIDDVVFLDILYPNDVMAHIHVSWLDPQKIRKITIVGSKKMVIYDDIAENKITVYDKGIDEVSVLGQGMDFDSPPEFGFNHRSGDVVIPKILWKEPLKTEIDHFADCVVQGLECLAGPDHAAKVVDILSKAN
jgi:predicted dehydrogenase